MCAAAKNCKKFTKNPSFGGSRFFQVIAVDKSKKPATSACDDKQRVDLRYNAFLTADDSLWTISLL